jgi:hypothetical protein
MNSSSRAILLSENRLTNLTLVSVDGRCVDVAVADLEGGRGGFARRIALNLPGPESDDGYLEAASRRDVARPACSGVSITRNLPAEECFGLSITKS